MSVILPTLDAVREVAICQADISVRRVFSGSEWDELLCYELQHLERVKEANPDQAELVERGIRNALFLVGRYGGSAMSSQDTVFGLRKGDSLIGAIKLDSYRADNSAEVGFWISKENEGRGYMTAAARAVTELALADVSQVYGRTSEFNGASQRVLEKCGFREFSRTLGEVTMRLVSASDK